MKTIIAGGRHYILSIEDYKLLDSLPITEVISGTAPGADQGGEVWAESKHIKITKFPADWNTHGRAAGPIRNKQMAEYADAVVLFPGGRGTKSMLKEAKKAKLKIYNIDDLQ